MMVSAPRCLASLAGVAALFSMGFSSAAHAQEAAKPTARVSCRPVDANGSVLPFLATDATVKCEMFLLWQQDCRQTAFYDPTGAFHAAYCLSLRTREAGGV